MGSRVLIFDSEIRLRRNQTIWVPVLLGVYHDWCPDARGIKELARFPMGHPDAAVRCGHARQVSLVQAVARREFEKVGHRSADKVRTWRLAVAPAIDVGLHDLARGINVVAIEAGAMIFVFPSDTKATNGSTMSFSTAGDRR